MVSAVLASPMTEFALSFVPARRAGIIRPLEVGYVFQVVWVIPEELMKRVSRAQFLTTLCLVSGFVNRRRPRGLGGH